MALHTADWHRLVLHPRDPDSAPPGEDLVRALAQIGLAGEAFQFRHQTYYATGQRFLDLVVFLGCSPSIALAPVLDQAGEPRMERFCHLRIPPVAGSPVLRVAERNPRPRCPGCGATLTPDAGDLVQWSAAPQRPLVVCAACGQRHPPAALAWRRGAGAARCFVEVGGIFPQEALPSDGLLAALGDVSRGPWDYFYTGGPRL